MAVSASTDARQTAEVEDTADTADATQSSYPYDRIDASIRRVHQSCNALLKSFDEALQLRGNQTQPEPSSAVPQRHAPERVLQLPEEVTVRQVKAVQRSAQDMLDVILAARADLNQQHMDLRADIDDRVLKIQEKLRDLQFLDHSTEAATMSSVISSVLEDEQALLSMHPDACFGRREPFRDHEELHRMANETDSGASVMPC